MGELFATGPIEAAEDATYIEVALNLPLKRRIEVLEAVIADNLSNAMDHHGESDVLTDVLADEIFGAIIDFQKDPREGDRVGIVFEKLLDNT